jgi:uncharacterized protein (TIGR02266 family)
MTNDGRRDPRQPISLEIRFKSATLTDFIERYSRDISRGGIFIKTKSPMPSGTLIKFDIGLQNSESIIQGVGRVVWRRLEDAGDESPAGMGIKFIKLDSKSRENLDTIVANKTEDKSGPTEAPIVAEKATSEDKPSGQIAPVRPQAVPKEAKRTIIGMGQPSQAPEKAKPKEISQPFAVEKAKPTAEQAGISDVFTPDTIEEPPRETDILADISSAIDKALDFKETEMTDVKPSVQGVPAIKDISGAKPLPADLRDEEEEPAQEVKPTEVKAAEDDQKKKEIVSSGVVSTRAGVGRRAIPRSIWVLCIASVIIIAGVVQYWLLNKKFSSQAGAEGEVLTGQTSGAQSKYTTIEVSSSPTGAKIYLNGEPQPGNAPLGLRDLETGKEVEIRAELFGYLATVEKVVPGDKTVNLDLELKPAKTTIKFDSRPDGAAVVIDGKTWGKTPLTVAKRGLGPDVSYTFKKPGYEDLSGALTDKDWEHADDAFSALVSVTLIESTEPLGILEQEPPTIEPPKPEQPKAEPEPEKEKPKKEKHKKEKVKKEEPKKEEPKPKEEKAKKEEPKSAIEENPF